MSAQPNFSTESLDEATELRIRVGEALCSLVESLAMAGKIRHARRTMAAVRGIVDDTARIATHSPENSAAGQGLRTCLDELQHRARNAETVLNLLE